MDMKQKKKLIDEYKSRKPEMGIISFRCIETGESFLGISSDTRADINSNCFKLSAGNHPNKRLQELWQQYGKSGFELSVLEVLKYDDPTKDYTLKLEALRTKCLEKDTMARRIWK